MNPAKATAPQNLLRRLAADFFEWMAFTNYSELTIASRRFYMDVFFTWCEDRALTAPQDVTRPVIERYQRWLFHQRQKRRDAPLSTRAQHTQLIPVRAYFKWLARRNHILHNPAADIDMPKIGHRLPKPALSITEVEQVLAGISLDTAAGLRDRAMLEVLYSSGLRRSELMRLGIHDVDPERGTLFIRQGKGRKDRVIPISERAMQWVDKYRFDIRPDLVREPDSGVLFLTTEGEPFTPGRLTQLARDYVAAANIPKTGACHLFRHTMATLMLENGADIRYIQQMLGHAKLETTQIYAQVAIRQLKHIHAMTHPASKPRRDGHTATAQALANGTEPTPPDPLMPAAQKHPLPPDTNGTPSGTAPPPPVKT